MLMHFKIKQYDKVKRKVYSAHMVFRWSYNPVASQQGAGPISHLPRPPLASSLNMDLDS